jgi:hypothetical protein
MKRAQSNRKMRKRNSVTECFIPYLETLVAMAASTTVDAAFSAARITASPLFSLFQT